MFGYFESKLAAEHVVAESGVPWTTLRAAQFHDLMLMTVRQMARLPVIPVPAGFRFQPVDADEVAAELVGLALGPPAGLVPDLAGPRVYGMAELIRGLPADGGQAPADRAGVGPRRGGPGVQGGADPPRPGRGPAHVGGFLAERVGPAPKRRRPGRHARRDRGRAAGRLLDQAGRSPVRIVSIGSRWRAMARLVAASVTSTLMSPDRRPRWRPWPCSGWRRSR